MHARRESRAYDVADGVLSSCYICVYVRSTCVCVCARVYACVRARVKIIVNDREARTNPDRRAGLTSRCRKIAFPRVCVFPRGCSTFENERINETREARYAAPFTIIYTRVRSRLCERACVACACVYVCTYVVHVDHLVIIRVIGG